jgi:hypothetical protein
MRTKQTERREREKILNSLMQSQKRVKNYGGFYRVESSKKLWRFLLSEKIMEIFI